jgi:hypothetical protein
MKSSKRICSKNESLLWSDRRSAILASIALVYAYYILSADSMAERQSSELKVAGSSPAIGCISLHSAVAGGGIVALARLDPGFSQLDDDNLLQRPEMLKESIAT